MRSRLACLSPENAFKIFDSLIENRVFSRILFGTSIVGIAVAFYFSFGSYLAVFNNFRYADLYKISLFASGVSPYSTEPWAAPYPPFYFMVWVLPYILFSTILRYSIDQIYFGLKLISVVLSAGCSALIYKMQISQGSSRTRSLSLSSLFVLSSLTGLIQLTGDFFGLFFLALGSLFLVRKMKLVGLFFVSLSVAFLIQPVFGLLALLVSSILSSSKKDEIGRYLLTVGGVAILFGIVPILIIKDATAYFLSFNTVTIQAYSFNLYSGVFDLLENIFPSAPWIVAGVDIVWAVTSISSILLLLGYLAKQRLLRAADPVDLLSLGIILWLIVLKQTVPYYFLWALVPLLVRGRTRSVAYVFAGEFFGMVSFGISYLIFGVQTSYSQVPNIYSSSVFLIGGAAFVSFMFLALSDLLKQMRRTAITTHNPESAIVLGRK